MIELLTDIQVIANFRATLRERGKLKAWREGHNVMTNHGRDWLAHLSAWKQLASGGADDKGFTNRRVRWVGVGTGAQLEQSTVTKLATPVKATATDYFIPIQTVDFPTSTSVRFLTEFGYNQISLDSTYTVAVTEASLFADVQRVSQVGGLDDLPFDGAGGSGQTTLDPAYQQNVPVTYKTFGVLTKTTDFTLEIQWTLRFEC